MVVPDNASLALTKFDRVPPATVFDSKSKKEIFKEAPTCTPSEDYKRAYERWNERIAKLPGATLAATFTVDGRMIVGIGAENILESSIAMNRLWGMPLIPGSALKGLASHYTASMPSGTVSRDQQEDLFGTTELAGCITWLDAWYVPEDLAISPFTLDVVTVHHQSYYQNAANPPSDFEDPIPSNFISVRGTFLVAVQAPDQNWAFAAMKILIHALDEWGIGAKTNAGYGRLMFREYQSPWVMEAEEAAAAKAIEEEKAAAANQQLQELLEELGDRARPVERRAEDWVKVWDEIDDDAERTRVGTLIFQRLQTKPSEYHRVTGRVLPAVAHRQPAAPRGYIQPLLDWMDEHAPDVGQP